MTDKRIQEILNEITVIIDTREHQDCNLHLTKYFDKYGIKYINRKLDFADYSFICPPIPEIGFDKPTSFEQRIAIERKMSLDELSGNVSNARERFERELQRARDCNAKLILMVEQTANKDARKALNEIANALGDKKGLLLDELNLLKSSIADIGSYKDILNHRYRTNLNEKSYIASLFSFQVRYGIGVEFIPEKLAGWFIYNKFKYFLREELKQLEAV